MAYKSHLIFLIGIYQIKNYWSDLDKLDIFEQYGSNYVGIAYFQHYQTAGADVEAALKDGIWPPPQLPSWGELERG